MTLKSILWHSTPPILREVYRSLLSPGYLRTQRELRRLRAMPRYVATTTNLLGAPLEVADAGSLLYMYGEIIEQELYRFVTATPAPYILDGGANMGLSVLYFKRLYPRSTILAFEPDPALFALLERNVQRHRLSDVQLCPYALWTAEGTMDFASEGADGGRLAQGEQHLPTTTVQARRLRDYLDRPIDLLKLDIEGAETEVLQDCADRLHWVERLFVEYHSFEDRPQMLHLLLDLLSQAGFRYWIDTVSPVPQPFVARPAPHLGMDVQLNIFAFRP